MSIANRRVLPGFGLGLGYTVCYLMLLVLLPLLAGILKACELSWSEFVAAVWTDRAIAAYKLTISVSLQAALINVALGLITAWTLVRYEFPGKKIIDALVDIPFALPTAVAGLVFASLYMPNGWMGQLLSPLGLEWAYSRSGIVLVLVFTGFPFVVRTVQPVLEDLDKETEQAAATLGASRWQTFRWVILPILIPPTLTGFTLAFARALGEYGSVVFITRNKPFESEIAPMLIFARLEAFEYREAAAIAVMLLIFSFTLLILINILERWSQAAERPKLVSKFFALLATPFQWFAKKFNNWTAAISLKYIVGPTNKIGIDIDGKNEPWLIRKMPNLLISITFLIALILIIIPLFSIFYQAFQNGIGPYFRALFGDKNTRHAIFLSLIITPLAVALNTIFGVAAAYTISRFRFPGRSLLMALIDIPFSVSPIVAGLVFVLMFGVNTPIGSWLKEHGFQIIFAPPGLVLATAFVTFPIIARELIPVMEAYGPEEEIAARSLGANGWQMFWRITMPNMKWGLIYGVILCNARALGEFGAISVVCGRVDGRSDTMPLRVEKLFQEYQQPAAFALSSLLTLLALATLVLKAIVEHRRKPKLEE